MCVFASVQAQSPPPTTKLKDEMRQPWQRGDWNFHASLADRGAVPCTLGAECLGAAGSEAAARPAEGQEQKRADGTSVKWHPLKSWADVFGFDDLQGSRDNAVAYAFTMMSRPESGKALLSAGSDDGIRVWVNGKQVLARDGARSLTPDEDQVEVDLVKGDNARAGETRRKQLLLSASARDRYGACAHGGDRSVIRGFMPAGFSREHRHELEAGRRASP